MYSSNQKNSRAQVLIIILWVALSLWWCYIYLIQDGLNINGNLLWAATYQLVAVTGALSAIVIARRWGGWQSLMGRTMLVFSIGLLLQCFGQSVFSYYNLVTGIEVPYPSLADLGFFLSVPTYIYGTVLLGRVAGVHVLLKSAKHKILAALLVISIVGFSGFFFMNHYEVDWSEPLRVFLDFGYPLGQALYVSLAIITYILSRSFLGGIMRKYLLLILIALAVQYTADFNFLFQATRGTWLNGGYGDYIYLFAYFTMGLSLIKLGGAFRKIREGIVS